MSQRHGLMTPDANGRLEPTEFVPPTQVIRGSPNESGFLYLTSEDGKMVVGVWACDAYCERLEDYPYTEMCTVIEGAVEITPDSGESKTYRAGDTFFVAKGFSGLWESRGQFKKYFMMCSN